MQTSLTTQIKATRDYSLDWISGLLILHMIIGHIAGWVEMDYPVNNILFFFMPWFFFKGGMFHRHKEWKVELNKSFKRLIIPFIVFSIIGQAIWTIRLLCLHETDIVKYIGFPGTFILYGAFHGNAPLWFLFSLFIVRIAFNSFETKIKWFNIAIMSIALACLFNYMGLSRPYYLLNIVTGLFYYSIGYGLKQIQYNDRFFLICLCLTLLIAVTHPIYVDMRSNQFSSGCYPIWFIYCTAAIVSIDYILKHLPSIHCNSFGLKHIGLHAMPLYISHWIVLTFVDCIIILIGGVEKGSHFIALSIRCLILLPVCCYFIEKHFKLI